MSCLAVTGETTGRQCWEVHKDAVTCIIEKHIKDPALVKRLVDAWDSAVDLGVTTAKASPAQKKKKTDRAIRLMSVRQATSVLLSQIGLIACKWCVYCGLHDCCLTTKKQFGQLGDSEQCCGLGKDHLTRAPPRNSHTHSHTHTYTKHRNTSGQDHPDVAASYNNIANIYDDQGKYEEALEMHTKSLDIKTRMYGGDNHLRKQDARCLPHRRESDCVICFLLLLCTMSGFEPATITPCSAHSMKKKIFECILSDRKLK